MKKQITVLTLCAMLLALCFPAEAQQPGRVPENRVLTCELSLYSIVLTGVLSSRPAQAGIHGGEEYSI